MIDPLQLPYCKGFLNELFVYIYTAGFGIGFYHLPEIGKLFVAHFPDVLA